MGAIQLCQWVPCKFDQRVFRGDICFYIDAMPDTHLVHFCPFTHIICTTLKFESVLLFSICWVFLLTSRLNLKKIGARPRQVSDKQTRKKYCTETFKVGGAGRITLGGGGGGRKREKASF